MTKVVYESNGQVIGDGVRVTRVSDDGQTLEVLVDPKEERFSKVILVDEDKRTIDTFTSENFTRPGDAIRAEAQFHEEFIADMTKEQAVAYLLDVVKINIAAGREKYARIKDHIPKADRRSVQMLDILWMGRPRIMTYEFIGQQMEYISGSWPDSLDIASHIKRLRRALEQTDYPITITNHRGIGYSVSAPDDWTAPWDAT